MPTIDCDHWKGRRNRLPHLAGSMISIAHPSPQKPVPACPCWTGICTAQSETELQRQDRAARLVLSRGNGAKVGVGLCARREVVGQRRVGVARIEVVECVEHLNPELQNPGFLAQPEFL